jgi:transposase
VLQPRQREKLAGGVKVKEHAMSQELNSAIAVIGIDIGKNSFHVVGLDRRGAMALRQKWSRGQVEARLANLSPCLIGMEACVGAHHLSRKLQALGHDARLMPAKYVRPYSKGQKNDFRDAEAIAEAVQRPTMKFVATKTVEQLDLQALHRVRERLVGERTGIINQIRAFLLERGVAVRKGPRFLRAELPTILAKRSDVLSPRMLRIVEDLAADWRRLDERIEGVSSEIASLVDQDAACKRLMSVPGIGPIISSAMVAAIGTGNVFSKGRDFGAWLGLVPKQISTGDRTILGSISKRGNRYHGQQVARDFELLGGLSFHPGEHASHISSRARFADHEAETDGVRQVRGDDRDSSRRLPDSRGRLVIRGDNDIGFQPHQFFRQQREPDRIAIGVALLEHVITAFHVPQLP